MAVTKYRPSKGIYPPEDLATQVSTLLGEVGARSLSRELRVHREQLISIAARVPVLEGTIALVRERLRERRAA
jgi:hypothetical protein